MKSEGPLRAGIRQGFITGAGIGVSTLFLYLVYATCFYVGARFLEAGKITVPEIFRVCVKLFFFHLPGWMIMRSFLPIFSVCSHVLINIMLQVFFGLTMTAVGISQSGALAPDTGKAKSAAASIFALLDQKSIIESKDDYGITVENLLGDIEFQHVKFVYCTRPDFHVFRDFCLVIPRGQVHNSL